MISHVGEMLYCKQICVLSCYNVMVVYAKQNYFMKIVVLTVIYLICAAK
jgi:hypothetical protein